MPANLTPEYLEAEQAYKEASTTPEKIAALEHMLAVIPKHKGTEKMIGELRHKIAKLRQEATRAHKAGPSRGPAIHQVEKEGAGQVVLAGAPNTGKSALVARLTHAKPEVANYPFTTRVPTPGMMPFEDIQIQLVDLPPLDPQYGEVWVPQTIRSADAILIVVDLAALELLDEIENTVALLDKAKIAAAKRDPLPYGFVEKPTLVVANKVDLPGARADFEAFLELYGARFPAVAVSAETGEGLDQLQRAIFNLLGIIRVYSKEPGKKADMTTPFVLQAGETVADLAGRVHKEILAHLKYARVWAHPSAPLAAGVKYEGQMVHRDHRLADRDVVELHT